MANANMASYGAEMGRTSILRAAGLIWCSMWLTLPVSEPSESFLCPGAEKLRLADMDPPAACQLMGTQGVLGLGCLLR